MKLLHKILLGLTLIAAVLFINTYAAVVDIPTGGTSEIEAVTIDKSPNGDIVKDVNDLGFSVLRVLKLILQGVLVIYLVYVGITMIISMGTDEDKLSKSKSQLGYALIALVFINIPGTMYQAIKKDDTAGIDAGTINGKEFILNGNDGNIFVNWKLFGDDIGVVGNIIGFLEVFIFGVAIFVIIMAGIKIMTSRGRDEKITEAKGKIIYSIFAMIFVGFIEAWKQLSITGDVTFGTGIFGKMTDLALLFAGPVAIFFLTLAGYYYITSNGDEEKVKKAKNIIINTLIAVVLLAVMITFLNDLITL